MVTGILEILGGTEPTARTSTRTLEESQDARLEKESIQETLIGNKDPA